MYIRTLMLVFGLAVAALGQSTPTISLPGFQVRTVASELTTPTTMAFLGRNDFLVLEKDTGRVLRIRERQRDEVLDLAVNNASERGLLGIALHPQFPTNPGIYLFWTCRTQEAHSTSDRAPEQCDASRMLGEDTNNVLSVPLLGNRVDRFTWNGERLTFDRNIIALRSLQVDGEPVPAGQSDVGQPARGNHDGGVITFGPDGKLYIYFGDQGRRGWLQNLQNGPPPGNGDDQFGGPESDNAHLAGVILRLNDDGTIPNDNPLFAEGARRGGEAGTNLQKVFAYGLRNGFGITVDPFSNLLWISEHGDDTFDEINLVYPGSNGGWVQVIGPMNRIGEFKGIETTFFAPPEMFPSLQQWRWPPSLIADSAAQARSRMFMPPGAFYMEPQFSWRWATLPGALGFAPPSFGSDVAGNLLVAVVGNPRTAVGYLMSFRMHPTRRSIDVDAPGLSDRVADNSAKYDLTESEPLIVGEGFGIATDMKLSPDGTVYVVSLSNAAVYEVSRPGAEPADLDEAGIGQVLQGTLTPAAFDEGDTDGTGNISVRLHSGRELVCFELNVANVQGPLTVGLFRTADDAAFTAPLLNLGTVGGTTHAGCVGAPVSLIRSIRSSPSGHFVAIRNSSFPQGAIGGALR
jgi:hypothetical protein